MEIQVWPDGFITWGKQRRRCALGRSGIIHDKREGDGATPAGTFPLREVFYRADRLPRPWTGLPLRAVVETDGWCDAPDSPDYNRLIRRPHPAHHETLWRDDGLYDLLVVVGYNDEPPVTNRGSAIFLHVAKPQYAPTEGCVALARDDLLALIEACGGETWLTVNLSRGNR
jgi:L,D-peptidoglycan transpeptidase YkuD (ErfK/YbiS/YcfS/YnhG family)